MQIIITLIIAAMLTGCAMTPEQEQRMASALGQVGNHLQNHKPYQAQPRQTQPTLTTTCVRNWDMNNTITCKTQ